MFALFIFLGIVLLGIGAYFLFRYLKYEALIRSLGMDLLFVRIPRSAAPTSETKEKIIISEIGKFEQLINSLGTLKSHFVFEVAVPHVGEEIHFYVSVPKKMKEVALKQIQGLWNGASVETGSDDFNIFNPNGVISVAHLVQKEKFALPFRSYVEAENDTFANILSAFTRVNEVGEGAALQVVVRPADSDDVKKIHGLVQSLRRGDPLKKILGYEFPVSASEIKYALNPEKEIMEKKDRLIDEDAVRALESKLKKPLYEANIRLVASATSQFQADDIINGLAAGFSQFGAPLRNEFKAVKSRNTQKSIYQFIYRNFDESQKVILNSEEIAGLYHFPIATTETPKVKWLKAKEAAPPPSLPHEGVLIGRSVFRGEKKPIYITEDDRRRHVYAIGQTGTGKSTLMANMAIHEIKGGKGVGMIDPHGDLVDTVLAHIPPHRVDDVIYFDPGDAYRPLGLNMLDYNFDRPEEKTFIVNEMQGIFNKLFPPETMGPMFEQYMRNALLLLMEDAPNEPATLIEVPRVFTDKEFRMRKLARIKNPVVIDFWEKEAAKAGGEASLNNMTPYITSKFNNFISNDYMRPIIGQPKSAFNFREIMDDGKILLVNLSKGRIGDINANLLGMVITGKLLMAALSRVDIQDIAKRRDFNLYIDEFQNFTTDSIGTILSEARKYRLNLTIAHQFIAQLTEKIRDAVFGNVGSQIVFRVGAQDAEFLTKQFAPTFDQNDLLNIDNFNAYVKILVRGETVKPFNIETMPLGPGDESRILGFKDYSGMKYGRERAKVEEEIYNRLRG